MNGSSPATDLTPLERAERVRQQMLSTNDDEVTGEVDVSKSGLRMKGIPPLAMGAALVLLALGVVAYVVLKWRG